MTDGPARIRTGDEFAAALDSLRGAKPRRDVQLAEIPAPDGLAPDSIAFAADVHPPDHGIDSFLGTGRFIVLHDDAAPDPWAGTFRVVCYAQAPLEHEIGSDPLLPDVAWSWLMDALRDRGSAFHAASGTATTVLSTGFGGLADQAATAQIELRASWTPLDAGLGAHIEAWAEFLCMLAGLPPTTEGVELLAQRRMGRAR